MNKVIFTSGDSWTFGSEIVPPEWIESSNIRCQTLKPGKQDWSVENNAYRIPKIWPTLLGNKTGAEVVNDGWPARSNDTIYASTVAWLLKNYIVPGKNTSDLTVIVGWSGLERKNITFEDLDGVMHDVTIWPSMQNKSFYSNAMIKKYFDFHVQHLWNMKESITRFIDQNFNLHQMCKAHDIKHHFFSSFFVPKLPIDDFNSWGDTNVYEILLYLGKLKVQAWGDHSHNHSTEIERLKNQWDMIPESVFINKQSGKSMKSVIEDNVAPENAWSGIHPSPAAHMEWANYLHKFMVEK